MRQSFDMLFYSTLEKKKKESANKAGVLNVAWVKVQSGLFHFIPSCSFFSTFTLFFLLVQNGKFAVSLKNFYNGNAK